MTIFCISIERWTIVLCVSFLSGVLGQAKAEPNMSIMNALAEDGRERMAMQGQPWDSAVTERDLARGKLVRAELAAGRVREARDFFAAAVIMQHGTTPDDFRLAGSLAWIAYSNTEDKESVPAREASRLYAMAWDRLMLSLERPQWYMTQRVRDPKTHRAGDLLPNDPTLALPMDSERFSGPKF